jgi:hypothetical protein
MLDDGQAIKDGGSDPHWDLVDAFLGNGRSCGIRRPTASTLKLSGGAIAKMSPRSRRNGGATSGRIKT